MTVPHAGKDDIMRGIQAYGTYVPAHRLDRKRLGAKGKPRSVASHDEDTTSMGVEAARTAIRNLPATASPRSLLFATAAPAYLDKTNASAIHAALGLQADVAAYDLVGSVRSSIGALRLANASAEPGSTLVVMSDIRTGRSGSADERDGGDGAAAIVVGDDADMPVLAVIEAISSTTAEFLDRWRIPGELGSHIWEERFGEQAYVPLVEQAVTDACKAAGITPSDITAVAAAGLHGRAITSALKACGLDSVAPADDVTASIGNTGAAAPGLSLVDALDRAHEGDRIALITLSDGVDVIIFRATAALAARRPAHTLREQIAQGVSEVDYERYLTWRGALEKEPPRRPDPDRPAAPPSSRRADWKFGLVGSRCTVCSTRHMPPQRSCIGCSAVDEMVPERMADVLGTVATFTIDHLAFTLSPPMVAAAIDFDGGGRFICEITDVDPATVQIGDRVEMTFRCLFTAGAVRNYFWKARPLR
jgi:hydroxymethylglutaryl-CoA synthase